jgi:hypothetical protein
MDGHVAIPIQRRCRCRSRYRVLCLTTNAKTPFVNIRNISDHSETSDNNADSERLANPNDWSLKCATLG